MNRAQRMVLVLYCIALAYCCLWIPWRVEHLPVNEYARARYALSGYGWLWEGPKVADYYATPDLPLIGLRLLCVTALGAAAVLTAGYKSARRN